MPLSLIMEISLAKSGLLDYIKALLTLTGTGE
jgi:hypothetical protein